MENTFIVENTQDVVEDVTIEDLGEVSGAGCLGTAGTAGCPATIGTAGCW
ncbi:thiocillin family RiPP [Streptomyces sp. NPDC088253]